MRHWYQSSNSLMTYLLLPFSWIFQGLTGLRRFLYQKKIKKSYAFPVPVIVVGNITAGGTGKTPFVIWLANYLKTAGFEPGIVSRGVGGKQQPQPRIVTEHSNPKEVGDESILLAAKTGCPMVVGIDRVAAVNKLLADTSCNIVISDDGLQHYRMQRDIEINIVDGARRFGNEKLLPAGPLRESTKRLRSVDFIINHVTDSSLAVNGEFTMQLLGHQLISLKDNAVRVSLSHFQNTKIHAVAAIGNPERFFRVLEQQGLQIIRHSFPDHYLFKKEDIDFKDGLPVVMTEKDAVKCRFLANDRFWAYPVEACIQEDFSAILLTKIKKACKFKELTQY